MDDLTPSEREEAMALLARNQGRPPPVRQQAAAPSTKSSWLYYLAGAVGLGVVGYGVYWYLQRRGVDGPVTAVSEATEAQRDALMRQMLIDARAGKVK